MVLLEDGHPAQVTVDTTVTELPSTELLGLLRQTRKAPVWQAPHERASDLPDAAFANKPSSTEALHAALTSCLDVRDSGFAPSDIAATGLG